MASHSSPATNNSSPGTSEGKMPSTYPPCIHAANKLDPMVILQMEDETHHRGKRIAIRVDEPPTRNWNESLMTAIEDEEGTQAWLRLFNQPRETAVPSEQILRPGGCYLIKEPFLIVAANGDYNLRVDHPSDIFLLPHGHELLPVKWRNDNAVFEKSRDTRMKGNIAVGEGKWAEAESLYTTAAQTAETAEDLQLAYLNRSLTNLRLGRPATALEDAIKSYGGDTSARTEKALFREASALYELAKYEQCLEILGTARPGNGSAMQLIERVQARLREKHWGQYDFLRMYQQAKATPPLIDCATYTMPVAIKNSPGKGRGVFTTRKVLAGDLLICEKAFGYAGCDAASPGSEEITQRGISTEYLHTQIVQKLLHNIEDARSFCDLNHGDSDAVSVYEVDGHPVVDAFLVLKVMSLTASAAPRTSLSHHQALVVSKINNLSGQDRSNSSTCTNVGIWYVASHINHSCVSNACQSFIGDMRIIRATRDIEKGSELFISYRLPHGLDSYEEAQERLRSWHFTCDCVLCLNRKATPKEALMQRKSLYQSIQQFMGIKSLGIDIPNVQKTLEGLDQTYSATAKLPGGVRLELSHPCIVFGTQLLALQRPIEAIEVTLKGLEALGFVISASPLRGHTKSSKPELLIKQWGISGPFNDHAFHTLHEAYRRIAPQLSVVARTYMEAAYSMDFGEKETMVKSFPDMA